MDTKFEATLLIGGTLIACAIILWDHFKDMRRKRREEKDE